IAMAIRLPVAAYLGVGWRMDPPDGQSAGAVALVLEHQDPALSLPLYWATDGADIVAEWQSWGRVLELPLLVAEPGGGLREPFARIRAVRVGAASARRRRRTSLRSRRPSLPLRRRAGVMPATPIVHRGERENLGRN